MEHLEEVAFRLGAHREWYPPPGRVITREDWDAVKLLHVNCNTGLLANFSTVADC